MGSGMIVAVVERYMKWRVKLDALGLQPSYNSVVEREEFSQEKGSK